MGECRAHFMDENYLGQDKILKIELIVLKNSNFKSVHLKLKYKKF